MLLNGCLLYADGQVAGGALMVQVNTGWIDVTAGAIEKAAKIQNALDRIKRWSHIAI